MKTRCSTWFWFLALAMAGTLLSGCNAVGGLGRDLQSLGQKMEQKAYRQGGGEGYRY